MPLTTLHVLNVCKQGFTDGEQCRYLSTESNTREYQCLKKTIHKNKIDQEVSEFYRKNYGLDSDVFLPPLGDNCKGYPIFKEKMVGYDA